VRNPHNLTLARVTTEERTVKGYFVDEEQMQKLVYLERMLSGGSDASRDLGHTMWLLCKDIAEQEIEIKGGE